MAIMTVKFFAEHSVADHSFRHGKYASRCGMKSLLPLNIAGQKANMENQIYASCGNEFINSNANGKPVSCIPDQI